MRLIDADLLKTKIKLKNAEDPTIINLYKTIIKWIDSQPTVEKTGHLIRWYETIEHDNCTEHDPHCKCSECDKEYDLYNTSLFNYCPNCGAKMEKEDKE